MFNVAPILWREVKIYSSNPGRIVNYFVSPTLLLVFFGIALSVNAQSVPYLGQAVKFVNFFVPGLITFQIFSLFQLTFSKVRIDKAHNVITTVATTRTSLFSYYWGLLFIGTIDIMVRIFLLTALAKILIGSTTPPALFNVGIIMLSITIGSSIWFSLGFICGMLITREDIRDIIFSSLILPVSFASSLYYNVDQAPRFIRIVSRLNPITYDCDTIREAFLRVNPTIWEHYIPLLLTIAALLIILSIKLIKEVTE